MVSYKRRCNTREAKKTTTVIIKENLGWLPFSMWKDRNSGMGGSRVFIFRKINLSNYLIHLIM